LKASDRVVLWSILIMVILANFAAWLMVEYPTVTAIRSILMLASIVGIILLVIAIVIELALPTKKSS